MSRSEADPTEHESTAGTATRTPPGRGRAATGAVSGTVHRTRVGISVALSNRLGVRSFVVSTLGYLLVYLWVVRDLGPGSGSVGIMTVTDPISRAVVRTGTFRYEAVAVIDLGPVSYLFSPINLALGGLLAALVGLNIALTVVAWRHPAACGIDASSGTGVLAGLPALLSGTACCGPIVLIVVGVQASGLLLLAFDLLVPVAVLMLLLGLVLVGRQVDPALVGGRTDGGGSS